MEILARLRAELRSRRGWIFVVDISVLGWLNELSAEGGGLEGNSAPVFPCAILLPLFGFLGLTFRCWGG